MSFGGVCAGQIFFLSVNIISGIFFPPNLRIHSFLLFQRWCLLKFFSQMTKSRVSLWMLAAAQQSLHKP